jgi:hypothetical protein
MVTADKEDLLRATCAWPENIRINAVRVGIVATDIHASGRTLDRIERP